MADARVRNLLDAIGAGAVDDEPVTLVGGDPYLATAYPVGEVAATALGAVGAVLVDGRRTPPRVTIDVRHAAASLLSLWLCERDGQLITPLPADGNPTTMSDDNPLVALYPCGDDRWVHVHGTFEHLAAPTRDVLGVPVGASVAVVADAVRQWKSWDLEDALAAAGTCGVVARSGEEWRASEHGRLVAATPQVVIRRIGDGPVMPLPVEPPLAGLRVLDATRILAGPVCGRLLGEHGADVLLVASPSLPDFEQSVIDTGHGKRSTFLDLRSTDGRSAFLGLAADADVVIQSYRGRSFERHGLGAADLAAVRPGIVHASISCYGVDGPWADRPGWEHMAQTAAGLAVGHGGMDRPRLLPAAVNDYGTGFLAALGIVEALRRRSIEGGSWAVEASLARTATWVESHGPVATGAPQGLGDVGPFMVAGDSPFGHLRVVRPPLSLRPGPPWSRLAVPLGSDFPVWN